MVTTSRRPHREQWRTGSKGRPQPGQAVEGRPHPVQ